jgi:alkane 1-monooxygenase
MYKTLNTTLLGALPFWMSLLTVPLPIIAALKGGWFLALPVVVTWYFVAFLDNFTGLNEQNPDPDTPNQHLFWYRLITIVWPFVQAALILWMLWYVPRADHLSLGEKYGALAGMGILSGTIGINYAHELMHQRPKFERWLGDILMAMVQYGHFRSEHLLVHHTYVGTPRDPVTARYNEGFHRYFARVIATCPVSAFRAEKRLLSRRGSPWYALRNPFWRYALLQGLMLVIAFALAGWLGLGLYLMQAFIAILSLELTNYIEHYGLTREHLGDGKYEHVKPHHSWNASHKTTNWLLINLQRHSDHHYKPDRRFPLLQTYSEDDAPQLPMGYPFMGMIALVPPVWRRMMNPKVRAWRRRYYPHVTDWAPYKNGTNPQPR